jgi:hypothetical protein
VRELREGLPPEQVEIIDKALKAIEDKNREKAGAESR